MAKKALFNTSEALLKGYRLNEPTNKRKVYLRGRIMKSGKISLYYYGTNEGKVIRQTANLFLNPEFDTATKSANEETIRIANVKADLLNADAERTGNGFTPESRRLTTFNDYITKYLAEYEQQHHRKNVVARATAIHFIDRYGKDFKIRNITKAVLLDFIEYLKNEARYTNNPENPKRLAPNTVKVFCATLGIILERAKKQGVISVNPFSLLERGEKPHLQDTEREYLDISELKRLAETPCDRPDVKNAFLFSCFTGLRLSDVEHLRGSNIKRNDIGEYIDITMKKTQKPLRVYLSNNAKKLLPEDAGDDSLIFPLPSRPAIKFALERWSKKAALTKHITFHTSRHTAATMLLNFGVDIATVASVLGHAKISTTQIYAKLLDKTQSDAINKQDTITI